MALFWVVCALTKGVVTLGFCDFYWFIWIFFLIFAMHKDSSAFLSCCCCVSVLESIFADPLLSNKDSSSGMARLGARCLFWVCEQVGQVCGWGMFIQPFLLWCLWQRRCLLAAVSQSVKASFPPGAGTDLKLVKCAAILRRANELKQGFIMSDSFQKMSLT